MASALVGPGGGLVGPGGGLVGPQEDEAVVVGPFPTFFRIAVFIIGVLVTIRFFQA